MIKTDSIILPAFWASALMNNDFDAYSLEDKKEISEFYSDNPKFKKCISCNAEFFLDRYQHKMCLCADFVFTI